MSFKETKTCECCGEEFPAADDPEDLFECKQCKKEREGTINPENEFNSLSPGGR